MGPGRSSGPSFFSRSSRNSRNSRGSRWGVIAASRAARLAETWPPPYEVDHVGVAGVAGVAAGASASVPTSASVASASRLSFVRARLAFPPETDEDALIDAPYARSAAATRRAMASRLWRSRSRAAAARPTGVPVPKDGGPASSSRARSPQSVPGDVHAALARLRTSAIAARPAGVEAGVGSPNPARRGGDGETWDASLPTTNPPTGLASLATRGKGVRRSSSAAAFNRRACASGDCRTTRADGFGVDVDGADARGVASRSAAATRFSVSRARQSSGPTTGALDVEGCAPRPTPRGCVHACVFARARDSRRRTCLSLYGEASSASLARAETFNETAAGVVDKTGTMSTERDPEASHASCAEVVSPRPDGASPPESIEVVACALLQTPHLRHFRATAERGALWKARVELRRRRI